MSPTVLTFITSYVLMPIIASIMLIIAFIFAKKNKLLSNRKLIFFVLLSSLLLCSFGLLGFIDYWFMPYVYIGLQILYLILGWYAMKFIKRTLNKQRQETPYYVEFGLCFLVMFVGGAFFSLIFNLCNELQYGIWASTCLLTFVFPSLLTKTYNVYMEIPLEIHNVWKYAHNEDLSSFESMDYNKLMVMELEIFKQINDPSPSKVKAKAPDNMPFGVWFQKFLTDYNIKFTRTPIDVMDQKAYGWIFYIKLSFFHPRRYIDYEKTIADNKIKEKYTIIAKRVNEQTDSILEEATSDSIDDFN